MSDDLFPSGPWTGFYNYQPGARHRMDLHLTFADGQMSGDGNDDVGRFTIRGRYDAATKECSWTKTYSGSHDVSYRGFREGKGIWGTWEIKVFDHGGFHIWPKGAEAGDGEVTWVSRGERVDAVAHEVAPAGEDMQNRDHACFFSAAHAAKDSSIALKLARARGMNLPLASATKRQYDRMVKARLDELDKSGIAELTFKDRRPAA